MKCQCLECICEKWFDFVSEEHYITKKECEKNQQLIEFLKTRMDKIICQDCDEGNHEEKLVI
jgi:hypothetical protein